MIYLKQTHLREDSTKKYFRLWENSKENITLYLEHETKTRTRHELYRNFLSTLQLKGKIPEPQFH